MEDNVIRCSEVLWVLAERLLGPLWNQMNRLSVALGLLVECCVLIPWRHLRLFGQLELQVVDFFEPSGFGVGWL